MNLEDYGYVRSDPNLRHRNLLEQNEVLRGLLESAKRDAADALEMAVEFEERWSEALGGLRLALACLVDAEGEIERLKGWSETLEADMGQRTNNFCRVNAERERLEAECEALRCKVAGLGVENCRLHGLLEAAWQRELHPEINDINARERQRWRDD